jgi:hypothetical protein
MIGGRDSYGRPLRLFTPRSSDSSLPEVRERRILDRLLPRHKRFSDSNRTGRATSTSQISSALACARHASSDPGAIAPPLSRSVTLLSAQKVQPAGSEVPSGISEGPRLRRLSWRRPAGQCLQAREGLFMHIQRDLWRWAGTSVREIEGLVDSFPWSNPLIDRARPGQVVPCSTCPSPHLLASSRLHARTRSVRSRGTDSGRDTEAETTQCEVGTSQLRHVTLPFTGAPGLSALSAGIRCCSGM